MFIENLRENIASRNLLNHSFYQLWNTGELTKEMIADYAKQYYSHVEAFPRYISLIHSQCLDIKDRQVLLENLIEEERGAENHPKLWRDFAYSLGVKDIELDNCIYYNKTKQLVERFFDLCRKSYASGLGALYAYEHQTPGVSASKIKGLKDFYNITSEKDLKFFKVHQGADEWHSQEVADLIEKLPEDQKKEAFKAASEAADLLWGFLDGMMEAHNIACSKA